MILCEVQTKRTETGVWNGKPSPLAHHPQNHYVGALDLAGGLEFWRSLLWNKIRTLAVCFLPLQTEIACIFVLFLEKCLCFLVNECKLAHANWFTCVDSRSHCLRSLAWVMISCESAWAVSFRKTVQYFEICVDHLWCWSECGYITRVRHHWMMRSARQIYTCEFSPSLISVERQHCA